MSITKQIGKLMCQVRESDTTDQQAKAARKALRALTRARALARAAKHSVGAARPRVKAQALRASQKASALLNSALRAPTMARQFGEEASVIQTEEERRYEMDQVIASARLEGSELSPGMLQLMERFVRAEITDSEFQRMSAGYLGTHDYEPASQSPDKSV